MNEYKKLDKSENVDLEAVREYATARSEISSLENRIEYLEELIIENDELSKYVWRTLEGKTIAIHDLEDDHLKNITTHLAGRGAYNKGIHRECVKRFGAEFTLPEPENNKF